MNKKLKTALRILAKSEANMVAVCYSGSRVVSWGYNKHKSLPLPGDFYKLNHRYCEGDGRGVTYNRHAEIDAIKKSRRKDIDCIIIVRITKEGNSVSKPCSMCRKFIEMHEIDNIIYFDWQGEVVLESI